MNAKYVNPFVHSIRNTFMKMCSMNVRFGAPGAKIDDGEPADVSSAIGFAGDTSGSVTLCFSYDVSTKIASAFAKTEVDRHHADFADALGELANIIAGGAKARFDGMSIRVSLPNVIFGRHHIMGASASAPRLLIPCNTEHGPFGVEVDMIFGKSRAFAV